MNETQAIQNNRALRRGDGGIRFFLVNSIRRSRTFVRFANPRHLRIRCHFALKRKTKRGANERDTSQ
jgi:hypothetical protein